MTGTPSCHSRGGSCSLCIDLTLGLSGSMSRVSVCLKRCHPKIPKSLQWNFVERFDSRKGKTYPKVWKKNSMEVMWFEKIMWKLMRPLRVLEYNFDHLVPKLVILLLDLEVS